MNILILAGLCLALVLIFAISYGFPRRDSEKKPTKRYISPTFARIYGLISIAILAIVAISLNLKTEVLTAVFTLFGTIAGYLAGAKAEVVGTPQKGAEVPDTDEETKPSKLGPSRSVAPLSIELN